MARTDTPRKVTNSVTYRFILEPYRSPSSRVTCPNCGGKHCFARYIDVTSGEHMDDRFGRCDRVEKCGYFESPYGDDVQEKAIMVASKQVLKQFQEEKLSDISLISTLTFTTSLTLQDNFSKFLFSKFDDHDKVMSTLLKYKVGESSKWEGATVFWQIDRDYDVRTGKIILYNKENGKRVKEPFPKISWEHVPDKDLEVVPDFNLKQCLFGEHLISDAHDIVHIVEAEKTAIICDLISDNQLWLSVGGIELVSPEKLQGLDEKRLIFYPDKGEKAFIKWKKKLEPLVEEGWNIEINRSIEKTPLKEGEDLADYILNYKLK